MQNRIDKKFKQLKARRKKAFVAFITAGDPTLSVTKQLVRAFDAQGVDIIELGVAFSDPLADGPTIQAASQRALKHKVNLAKIISLVKEIRKTTQVPIVLMTYYNPVFKFGEKRFITQASRAGVDGVIIPDLPPEEAKDIICETRKYNIATIFFLSPTSTRGRISMITKASTGFIYYVSLTGVTGARKAISGDIVKNIRLIKRSTRKPVCVGFGISTSRHVAQVSRIADGVIVGSAIVKQIEKNIGRKDLVKRVSKFVKNLSAPLQ
ncbi:tryptophan synthase subunit alpha [Candidatus Omnitrophota bacterium]